MKEGAYFRISGTLTNVGTSEETTIQLPALGGNSQKQMWLIIGIHFVRTGGSASNFQLRVGEKASWTNDDISERITYASQAVGTPINDVYGQPIPAITDANGRIYFRPGFDGSSDNDAKYEFWFKRAKGSG